MDHPPLNSEPGTTWEGVDGETWVKGTGHRWTRVMSGGGLDNDWMSRYGSIHIDYERRAQHADTQRLIRRIAMQSEESETRLRLQRELESPREEVKKKPIDPMNSKRSFNL